MEGLRGREAETAALGRALDRLGGRRPGVVCVAGEPGIGKTRLLGALAEESERRGILVLGGAGAEFERPVPFGPFVEALDDHVAGFDGPSAARLAAPDDRARLAAVLPSLAQGGDGGPVAAGDARAGIMRALRALLEALAARRPLVLAVDDLHWADDGSLELVSHFVRRRPRAPVLLALAYRPLPLAERAGPARAAFIAGAADELLEPGPLPRAQAVALLEGRVAPGELDALVAESGGNPFYLEQLARAGADGSARGGLELRGVPPAVAGALAGELGRLSADERAVSQAAAVVGDPFEPELVAAAAARPAAVALAAIDALVRVGTVRQDGHAGRFRFRHPILRRAAYESATPGARLLAHRRVAAALAGRGAPALARAHHVAASAASGDVEAAALLAEAGRAAAPRAPAMAARWYGAALRLLPATADGAERTALLVAGATAQGSAGMLEESRRSLHEALDTLPPELAASRLKILPFLALVGHMLGRHGESTALLRRALSELPDPETPEAAQLGIEATIDCLYEPDRAAMPRYAAAADRAARASGDPALAAAGAGVSALAAYETGEVEAALSECERAVGLLAPLTDGEVAQQLDGVLAIAWTAMCLERHGDCVEVAGRGLTALRATGQGHLLVPLTVARTVALTWRGELARAAAEADDLVDAARLSRVDQSVAWALTLRGWVATLAGDLTLAAECGEEACGIARAQPRRTYFVVHSILHLAETRLEQGRAEECLAEIVPAAGGPGLPVIERPMRPRWYEILTRASVALGRIEEAGTWAERAREAAAGSPLGGRRCEAKLAGAAVRLAAGDPDAAAEALAAARGADRAGDRLLAARARILAARAAAGRDRAAAIELLDAARVELAACGAIRARDEAVRELRRLGRRVEGARRRGRAAHGAAALSGREREVAELVTTGLTNREIAARLFLSEKTVESHLAAVFRKLGVPGRAAVGTALWRDEGAEAPAAPS